MIDRDRVLPAFARAVLLACMLIGLASTACGKNDIRGTYRIEILIEDARAPIEAILILTSNHLDVESLPRDSRNAIGMGSGSDYHDDRTDPNSCFILPSTDKSDDTPRSVTLFEIHLSDGKPIVPFAIFEAREQRMDIVKLQFFANALGGEVVFYEPDAERSGRLIGDRLDGPAGQQCIDAMSRFHSRIEALRASE